MHLHDESSEVLLPRTNDPSIQLACAGCGKTGVSICAKCAKTGYRKAFARANPLQKRDPELYERLDQMSRLSLEDNKKLWDEFCIEIKAGALYEHLTILVEIVHEGKWRTDALKVKEWLRENLARRVKRLASGSLEDYDPTGKRRTGGPKFDERNGALIDFGTQPFAEFELQNGDGDTMAPDEAIEGSIARKTLRTAGGMYDEDVIPMPADRDDLRFLSRRTPAERWESYRCEELAEALEQDRAAFDQALTDAINAQRGLVERMELDQDEAVVVAVIELLWSVGPRMYLNFLDGPDRKRIRNAWDRLDRRRKNPEWAARFRRTLRTYANFTRAAWSNSRRAEVADHERFLDRQGWKHLIPPDAVRFKDSNKRYDPPRPKWDSSRGFGIPSEEVLRHHTQMDQSQGLIFLPSKETPPNLDSHDGARPVELGWDLTPKQRALFLSSASKPKPRQKSRLYS